MADEDIAFDGTSPWGDQVSLSNHNSSSSSLVDKQQQHTQQAETSPQEEKQQQEQEQPQPQSPSSSATAGGGARRKGPRTPIRKPRSRRITQEVEVEQDLESNPLGPLGAGGSNNDDEEQQDLQDVPLNAPPAASERISESIDEQISQKFSSLRTSDEQPSPSPAVHADASGGGGASVASFDISVGDPIKVGDITSSHTVYTVHTKTSAEGYAEDCSVTRRYRDFRWVFHALENNNPGVIVPPPPEKQAIGRFNEDFVETRRAALENMLNKMAAHPTLQRDEDFKLFLQSDNFAHDVKNKSSNSADDLLEASTANSAAPAKSGGGGFMSSLGGAFSFTGKYVETNEWFIDKKQYLDSLESQLKSLAKALDIVVTQRRELSDAANEFAGALDALSNVEISKSSSELLGQFSQAQYRIKDLYARQCMQDILSLATTLDEYIRLIGSIRSVFSQRQKLYFNTQSAEQELNKRRQHLDKLHRQGKTLQDKISALQEEVAEQERKVQHCRAQFDDISKVIMREFDRFDHEKIRDFRNAVELFLENAVEAQKEAIEIWETFYQVAGFSEPTALRT
ncbi:hypothetical protein TRICI_003289 [Trichomonascus ciferrii]|uniref:PX domain-containing protein n=1 Tax=Trichomonascus ciferrii TaxID=44093 RepID=A0A642V3I5_9ASCO|nr:hypothetical protein TRICI_003289 [Trichomonascus ciferrii]